MTSLRVCEFKCPVCIIRCGFKGDLELGDSGLTTVSSNDNNDKNVLEGIERISIVVKSLVGDMADMKNRFESVTFTGAQVAEQITKVSTVVAQQEKSWAEVASGGSKGRNLDNNVLATEVARKVNKEITESKKSDLDRINRGKNVMVFGLKESTKVEDCEKSDMSLVDSLFQAVKGVSKPSSLKYFRLGKWSQNKVRPIKMIFNELEEMKVLFLPYKNCNQPVKS